MPRVAGSATDERRLARTIRKPRHYVIPAPRRTHRSGVPERLRGTASVYSHEDADFPDHFAKIRNRKVDVHAGRFDVFQNELFDAVTNLLQNPLGTHKRAPAIALRAT